MGGGGWDAGVGGWATGGHRGAAEPVGAAVEDAARSTSKSAVSRRFVKRTARELERLMARDLGELDTAVVMVDGICFADHCCVVALAVTADGTKVPVGLWLGDTENATVVRSLLADLVARGLDATGGLLVVIDGAKALASAVRRVFGDHAVVQRCTLHKRRNVADHLPTHRRAFVDPPLAEAFGDPHPPRGVPPPPALARHLPARHPDAAAARSCKARSPGIYIAPGPQNAWRTPWMIASPVRSARAGESSSRPRLQ